MLNKLALGSTQGETSIKNEALVGHETPNNDQEDKPRDQVMADRKAKKLAAQARKGKSYSKSYCQAFSRSHRTEKV